MEVIHDTLQRGIIARPEGLDQASRQGLTLLKAAGRQRPRFRKLRQNPHNLVVPPPDCPLEWRGPGQMWRSAGQIRPGAASQEKLDHTYLATPCRPPQRC